MSAVDEHIDQRSGAVTSQTRTITRRGPMVQWLLVVAPAAVLALLAWQVRWMSDDGFIHFQVVQQLAEGHGPVVNVGERIEASTSPLWVGILLVTYPITGLALPWKAVFLGIGLSAAGVVAAQRAARALARTDGRDHLVLPVGAVMVAALPPFWEFATSGLETGLAFAWLGLCCWWCARRATTVDPPPPARMELAGAALIGLGPLIRPDLGIFSLAFGTLILVAERNLSPRRRRWSFAAMLALPLLFQVFRMGYYGMLIPNTALAKEASGARWGQGWRYLVDLVSPYWLVVPVGLVVAILAAQTAEELRRRTRLRAAARIAPAAGALVHALYIVRFGGDFMHARLLLPSLFALMAPVGLPWPARADASPRRPRQRAIVLLATATATWALVCSLWLRPTLSSFNGFYGGDLPVSDDNSIEDEREVMQALHDLEHPIRIDALSNPQEVPDGTVLLLPQGRIVKLPVPMRRDLSWQSAEAVTGIGGPSFTADDDEYVIDAVGLAHPVASHLEEMASDRPGHQKFLPLVWQAAQFADVDEVYGAGGQLLVGRSELAAARHALTCGQLNAYIDDAREPLTIGRFLGNMFDSVANSTFRVPSDPFEAEQQLCG
jgi:arabinofuranosyltransferase